MSSISDIFASPFKLSSFKEFTQNSLGFKAIYKTQKINGGTTKQEVYILSKMYFDNIVKHYENYVVNNKPITETTFRLVAKLVEDDYFTERFIYSMRYDNIENKITWENKYDDDFTPLEGDFNLKLEVISHVEENYYEGDYDSDYEEYQPPKPCKKAISETECIICFENKPNMLFLDCMHLCVCNVCDSKGRFNKCPMCRTKIKNQKIRIT